MPSSGGATQYYLYIRGVGGVLNIGRVGVALGKRTVFENEVGSNHTAIYIVVGVVVVLGALAAVLALYYCYRKRLCYWNVDRPEHQTNLIQSRTSNFILVIILPQILTLFYVV